MAHPSLKGLELSPPDNEDSGGFTSSAQARSGKLIPPRQHLLLISADDWEVFVAEWGLFQKDKYHLVTKMGGANDFGIDVACFKSDKGFEGPWDNFQCKYYKGEPLAPSTAIPEIGKILWHIYSKKISCPENYYFFAPKDCGPSLKKLLLDSSLLKEKLKKDWDSSCATSITTKKEISLEGDFLLFVNNFDFSIFKYKPVDQVIEEHRATPYFITRFGGGMKNRPQVDSPPEKYAEAESKYITQLFEAYSDYLKIPPEKFDVNIEEALLEHFNRQREAFYSAESLRAFARDTVLPGTFTALQKDIYHGVIDIAQDDWDDSYKRVKETLRESKLVPVESNGLFEVVRVTDRYGICHQLVNDQKMKWVKK